MATLDNERYLRHIWLIGEGGLFLLRRIVMREAANNLHTLEGLLLNRRAEFNNVLQEQRQCVFPSQTTVNADVNTWDISLLLMVLKKLFWNNLSPTDQSGIATVKCHRNHIQGHPLEISMNGSDYDTSRQLLEQSFRNLATGVNATAEIDDIIRKTSSENIDVKLAFQTIKEIHEFRNSMVCALQERFEQVHSEMSRINDSIEDIKGNVENIRTVQINQHEELRKSLHETGQQSKQDLTEIKANVENIKTVQTDHHQELTKSLQTSGLQSKQDLENIKDTVASVQLMTVSTKGQLERTVKGILQLKQMFLQKEKHRTTEELQTIIQADCADQSKQKEATDLLFKLVKVIQVDNSLKDEEIRVVITQRIQWYGELVLELIEDLISWFSDMNALPDAIPGNAQIGSIRIPISCSNISGLLTFLKYMTGSQCKQRLSSISATISKILLFPCTLVWRIENMNLQKSLYTPLKTMDVRRIVLPFHITSTEGLTRVVSMFGGEERTSHVEKISETLSKIFNVTIRLETHVDKIQLREAGKEEEEMEKQRKGHIVRSYSSEALTEKEENVVTPSAQVKKPKIGRSRSLGALKEGQERLMRVMKEIIRLKNVILKKGKYGTAKATVVDKESLLFVEKGTNPAIQEDAPLLFLTNHAILFENVDDRITVGGMDLLPDDNGLVVIDINKRQLYKLSHLFNVIGKYELPGYPCDVCYIGKGNVAVCIDYKYLTIVNVSKGQIVENPIKIGVVIAGIAAYADMVYIADLGGNVHSYNTTSQMLKKVYYNSKRDFKPQRTSIALSNDGQIIYVKYGIELLSLNREGKCITKVEIDANFKLSDICVIADGIILCDLSMMTVLHIDREGKQMLRKIPFVSEGNRTASLMCYDKRQSRLVIVERSGMVHEFKISAK